jgi:hypothetical protein
MKQRRLLWLAAGVVSEKPIDVGTVCLFGSGWVLNPVVRDEFRPGVES